MSDMSNDINLYLKAMSDSDTVISLTNHTYFSLGDPNINNLTLSIPSSRFIEVDKDNLLPLEELDVKPCLDFRNPKLIIKDINDEYLMNSKTKGYDHFFRFDPMKISMKLENDKYSLEVITNYQGVHIYTDNYEDNIPYQLGEDKIHRAIAIEPQDSPLDRKVLAKGDEYDKFITYRFKKK